MKITKGQMRSGFTLVELLVVISIIVVLAGLAVPTAMKALGKADQVTGISNAKGIKSALDLFASDFAGEYPSDDTAEELAEILDDNVGGPGQKSKSSGGSLRTSRLDKSDRVGSRRSSRGGGGGDSSDKFSNFYYQQLIGRGLDNEQLFTQKTFKKAFRLKRTNNDSKIDQGENVWAYTKDLQQTSSSNLPVVYDSPVSSGDAPRFHKKVWDSKIIVARLDNSTGTETIGGTDPKTGYVTGKLDGERVNLFSPEALEEGTMVVADLKPLGSNNGN